MELAHKLINKIDEVKKKLSDHDYTEICDLLKELSVKPKEDLYELELVYYYTEVEFEGSEDELSPNIVIKHQKMRFHSTLVDIGSKYRWLIAMDTVKVNCREFRELTSSKIDLEFFYDSKGVLGVDYPDINNNCTRFIYVRIPDADLRIIKKLN